MSVADDLLHNAGRFASSVDEGDLPVAPAHRLLVLACTDSRGFVYDVRKGTRREVE